MFVININNKSWDKINIKDIETLLKNADESFFFEFKNDAVAPKKLIEEISAFSNTYGGYIIIGVNDDKTISGCKNWTEERIHTTIHDSITPIPTFDIKKLSGSDSNVILILKVEKGLIPPYITNNGKIYHRLSSGSYPINDSNLLTQLYYEREDQFKKIEKKLSIEPPSFNPDNLCGYIDVAFSLTVNDVLAIQKKILKADLTNLKKVFKDTSFNISKIGYSVVISYGKLESKQNVFYPSNFHNFIEIMSDGSVKFRIMLSAIENNSQINMALILSCSEVFFNVYTELLGKDFNKYFVSAHKFEQLTVIKQFNPILEVHNDKYENTFSDYVKNHNDKYGINTVISSNRIPKNGFVIVDKKYFEDRKLKYTSKNIIHELFSTPYNILGFIDAFPKLK